MNKYCLSALLLCMIAGCSGQDRAKTAFQTASAQQTEWSAGEQIYQTNCAACHGTNGEGKGDNFPPLAQSDYIAGKPQAVIQAMVKGINGKITVNGKTYDNFMPASALNDEDTAQVTNYIINRLNNGNSNISAAEVAAERSK
ncbi:cytochrome c [Neisseria sp. ZJ106]|uniref:Cytochrome c n=1 Tax=Neisseria lisongii TaxID=2912188 RepID=A0ABY7RKH2_9NEIS|nr:cytochrome c [Neisseria lisongii]MCF7521382.1 cytochrome c [Neisseria lisongii]WCL71907.1 cytochrome c [Neisseria lisongii]